MIDVDVHTMAKSQSTVSFVHQNIFFKTVEIAKSSELKESIYMFFYLWRKEKHLDRNGKVSHLCKSRCCRRHPLLFIFLLPYFCWCRTFGCLLGTRPEMPHCKSIFGPIFMEDTAQFESFARGKIQVAIWFRSSKQIPYFSGIILTGMKWTKSFESTRSVPDMLLH